jgi:hypothetical protein
MDWPLSLQQWIGIGAFALLIGFIWFAFRQGMQVKPDGEDREPGSGGGPWWWRGGGPSA